MSEIEIFEKWHEFSFETSRDAYLAISYYVNRSKIEYFKYCHKCGNRIDHIASYICLKLLEYNLLDFDYEPLCCYCNNINRRNKMSLESDLR